VGEIYKYTFFSGKKTRPAAAVIPAPIAYIKVAAVKELVVGSEARNFLIAFGLCSERGIALMLYGGLIFQFPHLLFS